MFVCFVLRKKHRTIEDRDEDDVKNYIYFYIYDSYLFTMWLGQTARHLRRLYKTPVAFPSNLLRLEPGDKA